PAEKQEEPEKKEDMKVDQEGEKKDGAAEEGGKEGDKKVEAQKEKEAKEEEEDNVDYLKELDEEIEKADNDVFEMEDVTDIGTGEPLFFNFGFEDWALLSLRFELHLLAHAFLHDCGDPERTGIYPDHLLFYYNRYYKKGLNPKNYGVEGVEARRELVALVRDSIVICPPKVIESMLSAELEDNDIFVKLTEEARRERLRRLDAGDESARLKFATGGAAAKAGAKAPVVIPGKGVGKGETVAQSLLQQQRQQQVRQQMQMATGAGGMPVRPWGPPPAAFGVPLAQQRAMMARQPWG
ncbi:desi2, partial [Symbiodinium pilosum]